MKQIKTSPLALSVFAIFPRIIGFFTIGLLVLSSQFSSATTDPNIEWRKIETPHFRVIFDAKQEGLAQTYATAAEQAWTYVSPIFELWPEKTVLLVDDSSDAANGYATGIPYPMISAFPVLPSTIDGIGDYGSWATELLTHEYTHILTFEPATGVMRPLRWVFGDIIRPNVLLPRWYTEGLAVELETRLSNHGRLRSPNFLATLRAMTQEDTLKKETIGRINETSIPDWPGGARPYLMGALLWDEEVREKGPGIIKDINTAYSRRIPYFINGPLEDRFGLSYSQMLAKVYDRVGEIAARQLATIQAAGEPKPTKLEQRGYFSVAPVISPDGLKLAFIGKEHDKGSTLSLITRPDTKTSFDGLKSEVIEDGSGYTRLSWMPNSSEIVYNKVKTFDHYDEYSDLWLIDLKTKKSRRITKGARAKEAVVSSDGRAILFIQGIPGSTQIATVRPDGKDLRVLYTPSAPQIRISWPEFLSDKQFIVTEKQVNGEEVFKVFDYFRDVDGQIQVSPAAPHTVLADYQPVHYPRLSKLGLVFTSDRTGIANIYVANASLTKAHAMTNLSTRALNADLDMDGTGELYFGRLDSIGSQLYSLPREAWSKIPAEPPHVASVIESPFPEHKDEPVALDAKSEDYNPFGYMFPHYWVPYIYFNADSTYLQASTSANDPTGRHAYALTASYDTTAAKMSYAFDYLNNTTRVPLTFIAEDVNEYLYGAGFLRRSLLTEVDSSFFLFPNTNTWAGKFGVNYGEVDFFNLTMIRGGTSLGVAYTDAKQKGREISPERGGTAALTETHFYPQIGNTEYDQIDFAGAAYFSKWLPDRHAIALISKASIAPNLPNTFFGRTTLGGNYTTAFTQTGLVMRGYGSGAFIGKSMWVNSLEYRFPMSYNYRGFGTAPFFIQRWSADVFVDAITLDGAAYDPSAKIYRGTKFWTYFVGTGAEAKLDATIAYQIPIQITFGAYYGGDPRINPNGLFPFIGFGL